MQHVQAQPDMENTRVASADSVELPVRPTSFFDRKLVRQVLPWAVIAGMFVLWELAVRIFQIQQFVLPAPTAIFEELWRWRVPILENSWQTLMTTLVGFAFAIVIGGIGGVALGSSRVIYDGFYPALIAFNSVPKVAVIPVLGPQVLLHQALRGEGPDPVLGLVGLVMVVGGAATAAVERPTEMATRARVPTIGYSRSMRSQS